MRLTDEQTGFFAALWIGTSGAHVLDAGHADEVSARALDRAGQPYAPCARDRDVLGDAVDASNERQAPDMSQRHSFWVH